jgi:hypothetical protein
MFSSFHPFWVVLLNAWTILTLAERSHESLNLQDSLPSLEYDEEEEEWDNYAMSMVEKLESEYYV